MVKLDEKEINKLFFDCLFNKNEIVDGRPNSEFTSIKSYVPACNGECPTICFSTNNLNRNKQRIIQFIDSLSKIDEGNNLENLYYDSEGIKWFSDIKSLDQLLMMGKACGLLTYTLIQSNSEENIVIIKRDRENDDLTVEGSDPSNLPIIKDEEVSKPKYTIKELEIIKQNKKRISDDLKRDIQIIKTGLGFFGIKVEINIEKENQLDFFDMENNLITSYAIEDTNGVLGIDAIMGRVIDIKFNDNKDNEIAYCHIFDGESRDGGDIERHIFLLSSKNKLGYRIEIGNGNRYSSRNKPRILVYTTDGNADYIIKKLDIDTHQLIVELDNQFGPYGNYENGIKRELWYRDSRMKPYYEENLLYMIEDQWGQDGHHLRGDDNGFVIDRNKLIPCLTNEMFYNISRQIVAHPRNQKLIKFTLDELDKQLPGIKEFVINNYPVLKNVIGTFGSYIDPQIDSLVKLAINPACDLPDETSINIKKQ